MESATRKNTSSQYKITYMDGGGEFDDLEARRFSTAFTHTVKKKWCLFDPCVSVLCFECGPVLNVSKTAIRFWRCQANNTRFDFQIQLSNTTFRVELMHKIYTDLTMTIVLMALIFVYVFGENFRMDGSLGKSSKLVFSRKPFRVCQPSLPNINTYAERCSVFDADVASVVRDSIGGVVNWLDVCVLPISLSIWIVHFMLSAGPKLHNIQSVRNGKFGRGVSASVRFYKFGW